MKKMFKAPVLVLAVVAFTVASCGGGWSDDDKKQLIENCAKGGAPEKACECLAEKVMEKYPDPAAAKKGMEGDDKEWATQEAMKCLTGGEE